MSGASITAPLWTPRPWIWTTQRTTSGAISSASRTSAAISSKVSKGDRSSSILPEKTRKIDTSLGNFAQDDPEHIAESRIYYGQSIRELKQLQRVGILIGRLRGRALISVYFRAEGATAWTFLQTFKVQSDTSTFDDPTPEETRGWLWSNVPADTTDTKTGRPVNVGFGHQVRFVWCGDCDFIHRLETVEVPRSATADNPVESVDLSAATCGPTLPSEPTSPALPPSLVVYAAEYYSAYGYEGDAPVGATFDMGTVLQGASATKYLILYNAGGSDLVISGLTLFSPFAIVDQPDSLTIPPGTSQEIGIRGIGYEAGTATGTLAITSNDPASPREIDLTMECVLNDIDNVVLHADNEVWWLFRQSNGGWIVGGLFQNVGQGAAGVYPTARNRLARLDTDGVLDASWNPNADGFVFSIAEQADGKILVGGNFTTIAGQTRRGLARLNTDGTCDTSFPDLNPGTLGGSKIIVLPSGDILVCGAFTSMGGATHNRVAKISSAGVVDAAFTTNCNSQVHTMIVRADGKIVIGGDFTTVNGTARNRLALLNADGTLDATFDPSVNGTVRGLLETSGGGIILLGEFTQISATTRNRIAKVNTSGALQSFDPNIAAGSGYSAIEQENGMIVIGGNFTTVSATTRNGIARVTSAGVLDSGFAIGTEAGGRIYVMAKQGNEKILVGGTFSTLVLAGRSRFGRLNTDGTIA